ncbi:MAG: hypothetical protein HC838_10920 [Spirulinaceae cyanobacterium RM2_2_10]|nr:hypothetical protein [Spirulinaceae cyanobacterium RM2_2_10]
MHRPSDPAAAAIAQLNQMVSQFNQGFEQLLASPLMDAVPPEQRLAMLDNQATVYLDIGQPERAEACLQQGLAIALQAENLDWATRFQARREALNAPAGSSSPLDPYSQLLASLQQEEAKPIAGNEDLKMALQALQQNDCSRCLQLAMGVYQRALAQPVDPASTLRYMFACFFIAFAREGLGDQAGTISILADCAAGLDAVQNPGLAAETRQMIEGLKVRWGNQAFQKAWQIYQLQEKLRRS